ncbi:putative beat protein, partial [Operophtera brumata]
MERAVLIGYFLVTFVRVSICLRVVGITVPALKQRGEAVTLTCDYDLEGGRLYSMEKSTARRVHLRELTLKSRGLFRCEVSEEAPSFHSAQAEAFMEVTDRSWLIAYGAKPAAQGLLVSTLGLRAPTKPRMKLKCVASIGSHRRERTITV